MFLRRCRLLLKRIYNSFVMFNEDQIAAAHLAQIFGSELLKVQNSAQTDSGNTPNIVNLNPKSFLVGQQTMTNQRKAEEQRLIQMLQREAEAACPLPPEPAYTPQTTPKEIPQHTPSPAPSLGRAVVNPTTRPLVTVGDSSLVLERIASSLERIANAVDRVDIKVKKKTVKRNANKNKLGKSILLNETTA
jgi:hypothetical protein